MEWENPKEIIINLGGWAVVIVMFPFVSFLYWLSDNTTEVKQVCKKEVI